MHLSLSLATLFIVLLVSVVTSGEYSPDQKLKYGYKHGACPAKLFGNKCHGCRCAKTGNLASCWFDECYDKTDDKQKIYEYIEGACPSKHFIRNCQPCRCNTSEDLATCIIGDCTLFNDPNSKLKYELKNMTCLAEVFGNECHHCLCSEDKDVAYCVYYDCYKEDENQKIYEILDVNCSETEHFIRNCQYCVCNQKGDTAFCTIGGECKDGEVKTDATKPPAEAAPTIPPPTERQS